jgi:anti-sigma B factor antagonist
LREGRSLVVVRSESKEIAQTASGILDAKGLAIHGHTPVPMRTATRQVHDVTIVDVIGRITVGEGNVILRQAVRGVMEGGSRKILLNLHEVGYIDSSGLGELVGTYTSVRNQGGQVKLVSLSKRIHDLLQMTRLYSVFDIQPDEATAIQSFGSASSQAVA